MLIFDILYSAFAGLVTFIFSLVITNGMVMAYVVFGEMLGFFIYYITFGVFAVRFSERVTKAVWVFKASFWKNITKKSKKSGKSGKKIKNPLETMRLFVV